MLIQVASSSIPCRIVDHLSNSSEAPAQEIIFKDEDEARNEFYRRENKIGGSI